MPRFASRRCLPLAALALGLALAMAGVAHAAAPPAPAATASGAATHATREARTKAQLADVRAEIAKIAAAQRATTTERGTISAKLAAQATALNAAANALRETDAAIAAREQSLQNLQQQRTALEAGLANQRDALAELLRAAYMLNHGSDLALLLGHDDIARIDRALAYSRYFQRDRLARIQSLLAQAAQLDALQRSIDAEMTSLQQQRARRAAQQTQLEQARAAQAQLLADADHQLAAQKDRLAVLQRNAAALDALLKQLQNVLVDIPAEVGANAPFAQLRGKLPWPVAGPVKGATGAAANGLVIAATPGAPVHAVAYGRVAWADFMRGYGILVIVDHGNGWMSLYGGNESAAVAAGDWVKPGQVIATVARNSEQGGAWFGIRHNGQAVDPRTWLQPRR